MRWTDARKVRLGAGAVLALCAPMASAAPAAPPAGTAADRRDRRAHRRGAAAAMAAPQEILRRSGFDCLAREFAQALAGARLLPRRPRRVVAVQGRGCGRRAVERAQGRGPRAAI